MLKELSSNKSTWLGEALPDVAAHFHEGLWFVRRAHPPTILKSLRMEGLATSDKLWLEQMWGRGAVACSGPNNVWQVKCALPCLPDVA